MFLNHRFLYSTSTLSLLVTLFYLLHSLIHDLTGGDVEGSPGSPFHEAALSWKFVWTPQTPSDTTISGGFYFGNGGDRVAQEDKIKDQYAACETLETLDWTGLGCGPGSGLVLVLVFLDQNQLLHLGSISGFMESGQNLMEPQMFHLV